MAKLDFKPAITAAGLPSGIDAAKIADGSVSNTEFQYLDGVTSNIQTQLNGKFGYTLVAISSNTNAVVGTTYLCDTSAGIFTLTLPASPATGDYVALKDAGHAFNTNNLTIGRNGKNIESLAVNYILFQNDWAGVFVYNGTQWVIF